MRRLIPIIALLYCVNSYAQSNFCITCVDNPYGHVEATTICASNYQGDAVSQHLYKKMVHFDFHESIKQFRIPSTISAFANYRFHSNGYQKKPFVADGDLNMPISIRGPNSDKWMHTFQVIPRFKFRIFANDADVPYGTQGDISLPVRTPSAMPGVAWYFTKHSWWTMDGEDPPSKSHDKYFGLYLYHHSDGQDGNELDTLNGVVRVNQYNGNFGEQLVAEVIMGGRFVLSSMDGDDVVPRSDPRYIQQEKDKKEVGNEMSVILSQERKIYWTVSYEWRPDVWTNKVFDTYDIYGKNRIKASLSYTVAPTQLDFISDGEQWCLVSSELPYEKYRHTLEWSYIVDANYKQGNINERSDVNIFDLSKRLNLTYTFHWIPTGTQNLGLFGQVAHIGSDEYNIYFQDSYVSFRAGLSFAFFNQPNPSNLNDLKN